MLSVPRYKFRRACTFHRRLQRSTAESGLCRSWNDSTSPRRDGAHTRGLHGRHRRSSGKEEEELGLLRLTFENSNFCQAETINYFFQCLVNEISNAIDHFKLLLLLLIFSIFFKKKIKNSEKNMRENQTIKV